ncbi:uncharacterized protein LOC144342480, partial [Saccoglossus kowalevskii]
MELPNSHISVALIVPAYSGLEAARNQSLDPPGGDTQLQNPATISTPLASAPVQGTTRGPPQNGSNPTGGRQFAYKGCYTQDRGPSVKSGLLLANVGGSKDYRWLGPVLDLSRLNHYDPQCHYDIDTIWTKEVGSSAFAATPLIYDVNMDGVLDIIGATFTEEITVVDGKTGQPIPATNWPFSLQDNSFHASPLQYDYNKDGQLDICICTSNADIVFFENDGTLMYGETIK